MKLTLSLFKLILLPLLVFVTVIDMLTAQDASDAFRSAVNDTIPAVVNDTTEVGISPEAAADTIDAQLPGLDEDGEVPPQRAQTREAERRATGDIVTFQARDSLTFNFRGERTGALYGSANVNHESGTLESGKIDLDLQKDLVEAFALSPEDTLSYPVLRRDGQDLRSTRILYNYKTEKGKFEVAEIEVDDGYLIGTKVKNVSRTEVFIEDGIYSSCPPDHMYYYIRAQRMKVVDEDEVFFTNARLYILDIPYPLIFPFGYIPAGIDRRRSGLLEPTYIFQNTSRRGIGVQNLGWFQYINDYMVAQTSFDVFTSGTFFNESRYQYRKSGSYSGSITLGYSREQGLEPTDLDFEEITSRRVAITHDQQLSPFANLSANINLNTSNYFQRNSFDLDERAQTSSTSRVSYRYNHPEGRYNFSVTSNLNQQFDRNAATLTGPQMDFSLRQFSPFESDRPGTAQQSWYERISVSYRNSFNSRYNFQPIDADTVDINWFEALFDPQKYREATGRDDHINYGFVQRAQVRAGQLIPSQFLNVSANIDYNEYWYPTTTSREFVPEENRVVESRERGFAAARDFNTSLNFSTTFYGISQSRIGSFEGLRHTVRPNVSFSYRPDFSSDFWGFYEEVQVDTVGNTQRFNRFDREVFGGPPAQEQRTVSFGITNVLETKRVRRDSTGEMQSTTLRLIDNATINSNYNFAADSLKLGNINTSISSSVIDGVRLRASASYSPYARDEQGRQIDTFLWNESGPRILQPLNYRLSASTSFSGGGHGARRVHTPPYRPYDPYDQSFFSPIDRHFNDQPVQSINAPWSVALDFSFSWNYRFGQDNTKSAVLNASNIRFMLTPKWSVSTRLGYDFIEKELTPSQFRLTREMVCWSLSFQFNPFGDFQYYSFRLSLNSGQVQSLFQKLPGLNNLERSSSPTGRPPSF